MLWGLPGIHLAGPGGQGRLATLLESSKLGYRYTSPIFILWNRAGPGNLHRTISGVSA